MKRFLFILFLLPLLVACANDQTEDAAPAALSGPSLVMFYTDN